MADNCNTDPNRKPSKIEKFNRKIFVLKVVLRAASAIFALYKLFERVRHFVTEFLD
jgi:hypothetical protein